MRLRTLSAVGAMVLIAAGLAGCRTNVGVAATIDGHRVSETQVNNYLTPKAGALTVTGSDGSTSSIPPRSFVVDVLIKDQLFAALLDSSPTAAPTEGKLSTLETQYLKGHSAHYVVGKLGATGYASSFESKIIEVQVLATLLNSEVSNGVNVNALASKLKFPVSVNPRYGQWDPKTLSLSAGTTDGLPGFLTLQPTAQSSAPTAGS